MEDKARVSEGIGSVTSLRRGVLEIKKDQQDFIQDIVELGHRRGNFYALVKKGENSPSVLKRAYVLDELVGMYQRYRVGGILAEIPFDWQSRWYNILQDEDEFATIKKHELLAELNSYIRDKSLRVELTDDLIESVISSSSLIIMYMFGMYPLIMLIRETMLRDPKKWSRKLKAMADSGNRTLWGEVLEKAMEGERKYSIVQGVHRLKKVISSLFGSLR